MSENAFLILYAIMMFLQTVHIFEEIAMGAYEFAGSLERYLKVASVLVLVSYLPLVLIVAGVRAGYFLAIISALIALGNGLIHVAGYIKTRSYRRTLGAELFTGIPLGIVGALVLVQLLLLLG
jgi:hypothetical protein